MKIIPRSKAQTSIVTAAFVAGLSLGTRAQKESGIECALATMEVPVISTLNTAII